MKSIYRLIISIIVTLQSLYATNLDLTQEEINWIKTHPTITFAVSSDYLPHSFVDTDGVAKGIQIDYIDLIAEKTGLQIRKKPNVWPKTLESAMAHKVDAIADLARRKEREKALNFTEVYLKAPFALITTDDRADIQTLKQFCGKTVAVTLETSAAKFLQKEYPCIKLVDANTENMLEKLIKKEVDAFFERYEVFLFNNKKALFSGLKVIFFKFIPPSGFSRLGVRNDEPLLLSILDKAINSITFEEQNAITTKWVNSSFPRFSNQDNIDFTTEEKNYLSLKQNITMCVNPDSLPFEQIDEQGIHKGISSDVIKIISQNIDKPITLVPTSSWIQTKEKFKNKECEILPIVVNTQNRQQIMHFTDPYISEPTVVVTKDDKFFIKDSSGLKGGKVGIVEGYAFIELLQQKHPEIEIISVKSILDGLKMVQDGELFGYVDTLSTIAYAIQKNALLNLKIAGRLEFDAILSMAIQKDDLPLQSIMQKALDNIEKAQIDSIIGKWISIKVEQSFDYRILTYVVIGFLIIILFILYRHFTVKKMNRQLEELSTTDSLTQLCNRNKLNEILLLEFNRANRFSYTFGIIVIDIDLFKNINDTHGHLKGDIFLKEISQILIKHSRKTDTVGRWGGEEFMIISSDTDKRKIKLFAEKLKEEISSYSFSLGTRQTASFGASIYQKNESVDDAIKRADDALYEAKRSGRNRVCFR
jgi:polar amino acid transport system substrate-binding protein